MTHTHALQAPQHDQHLSPEHGASAAAAAAASHTSPTSTALTAMHDAGQLDAVAPVADSTLSATREADANSRQPAAGTLLAVSQDEQQDAPQPVHNSSPAAADQQLKGNSISRTGSLDRQLSGMSTSLTQPGNVAAATTSVVRHASLPPASQHAEVHSQAEHADVESGSKGGGGTHVAVATELPDEQGSSASRVCRQECDQRCQELEQQSR